MGFRYYGDIERKLAETAGWKSSRCGGAPLCLAALFISWLLGSPPVEYLFLWWILFLIQSVKNNYLKGSQHKE